MTDDDSVLRKGHRSRRRLVAGLLAVAALVGAAVLLVGYRSLFPPRFACVTAGVLYRSGQPDGPGLRLVHRRYGIRTVVNLRSQKKIASDPAAQQEVAYTRRAEMKFHVLSLGADNLPRIAREFLRIVRDPENRPVLVHCAGGKERAGTLVAVYRMVEQHWPPERALREMKQFGFELEGNAALWKAAKAFAQRAQRRSSVPASCASAAGARCGLSGTGGRPDTCASASLTTAASVAPCTAP